MRFGKAMGGGGSQMAAEGVKGLGGWSSAGGPQCGSGIPWGGGGGGREGHTLDPDNEEPGPGQEAEG